ncbi:DUF6927 domain-containing protein [Jannaschia rubra]|uniref:DUF6927 domain-containing protein n=1 Tax=Jannaschia rubra TaxID=282197 RepID=A0A0M6XUN8_9RHOB|nr:hypothetical protein [Jannaschia rubra]CTQ34820.1 hypothetical protein JAN5088_03616 [Jannaschia rubra]SFG67772.1 hypothetical protein SAMN04488517_11071 [Jannaschia rubra]
MGWTTYAAYRSPKTREEERHEIVDLYTDLALDAPYAAECLMASKVGSTWYLAIRLAPKPGRQAAELPMRGYVPDAAGAIVYAGIVLTSRRDGEWGYKDMCETMGPHEAAAPLKLLDLLSPLDPEVETYAAAWRDRVAAHHAARRARPKVRPGDVIEFDEPIEFTGGLKARRFRAYAYRRHSGTRARILYETLDTRHAHTVRMSAEAIQDRGGRIVADAADP